MSANCAVASRLDTSFRRPEKTVTKPEKRKHVEAREGNCRNDIEVVHVPVGRSVFAHGVGKTWSASVLGSGYLANRRLAGSLQHSASGEQINMPFPGVRHSVEVLVDTVRIASTATVGRCRRTQSTYHHVRLLNPGLQW